MIRRPVLHWLRDFSLICVLLSACTLFGSPLPTPTKTATRANNTLTVLPELTPGIITVTGGSLPGVAAFTPTNKVIPTNPILSPTPETPQNAGVTPQEGQVQPTPVEPGGGLPKPRFDQFVEKLKNGKKDQVVGVYAENVLALKVVQQPPNNSGFVSTARGVATQFLMAFKVAGNIGLLAHNFLAGASFFDLKEGDLVQLVYGDGTVVEYVVSEIHDYQAISPNSPTSDFVALDGGERLSANDLFYRMYNGEHHLTFQTCIAQGNESSWGRRFVIATPQ